MNIRDLIPWGHNQDQSHAQGRKDVAVRGEDNDPVLALQADINRMFENFWRVFDLPTLDGNDGGFASNGVPKVDVREIDSEVEVVAELPGMNEGDVDISIGKEMLTIRGERKSEREQEDKGYLLRERSFGVIERMVPLPRGLDIDHAEATFRQGVLTVRIPKTAEAQQSRKRIQVKRG